MLNRIKKYISNHYFKVFASEKTIELEEVEEDGYKYEIMLPCNCDKAFYLRMDQFIDNKEIPYIKIEGCKNCDDIIIDETNKIVYIIEVKTPRAFRECSSRDFELKEEHTKLFLEYLFMLCDNFNGLEHYQINYIRWCYEECRTPSVRRNIHNFYHKYRRDDDKQVYKIEKMSKILLDVLFTVDNFI